MSLTGTTLIISTGGATLCSLLMKSGISQSDSFQRVLSVLLLNIAQRCDHTYLCYLSPLHPMIVPCLHVNSAPPGGTRS